MLKPDLAPISWHVFQWTTVSAVITETTIKFPRFSPSGLYQQADRWTEQCHPGGSTQAELGLVVFGRHGISELGKVHMKSRFASSGEKQGWLNSAPCPQLGATGVPFDEAGIC